MTRNELPLGVFDSGLGGLTVVRCLRTTLPNEDICYLGDTARVPYGTKSPSTVIRFGCEDLEFLVGRKVKAVVVACNTVSAWALPTLRQRFDLPIFGVVEPGARAAVAVSRTNRIGVIGTPATIRSESYPREIRRLRPQAQVFSRSCPLLVPLVEEGLISGPITNQILAHYLGPLLRRGIDTLVLGCTHYPLLKAAIRRVAGAKVRLVDSAECCAADVRVNLERLGLRNLKRRRDGRVQPFVTDEADRFEESARRFLRLPIHAPQRVELTP